MNHCSPCLLRGLCILYMHKHNWIQQKPHLCIGFSVLPSFKISQTPSGSVASRRWEVLYDLFAIQVGHCKTHLRFKNERTLKDNQKPRMKPNGHQQTRVTNNELLIWTRKVRTHNRKGAIEDHRYCLGIHHHHLSIQRRKRRAKLTTYGKCHVSNGGCEEHERS